MRSLGLGALLSAMIATTASADDGAMAKTSAEFYSLARASGSGLPDHAARARMSSHLSQRLSALLGEAAAAQSAFAAANKNSPPLLEGDLYSSLFEGPTAFAIGTCTGDARTGHCAVNLTYDDKSNTAPLRWTDTIFLVNAGDGWKVDDIGYGGTWDFGNKGRLGETLRQVAGFVSQK